MFIIMGVREYIIKIKELGINIIFYFLNYLFCYSYKKVIGRLCKGINKLISL